MARKGYKVWYEDDLVEVYDNKGRIEYKGLYDYCMYKDEPKTWNESAKCYDLAYGYKLVGLTEH